MTERHLPVDADRDFTASAFIVRNNRLLLLKHDKLEKWLPPGGHIEEGETPDEAAIRETKEEVGFEVEIMNNNFEEHDTSFDLPEPFNVNLHRIEDGHWHCDFCFLTEIVDKNAATHSHEHSGTKWFSKEELKNEENMPENVRNTGLKALDQCL